MPAKLSTSRKTAYALVGAPVWAARKIAEISGEFSGTARKDLDEWIKQGEKVTKRLQDRNVVEELSSRVDFDQIQEQVERLRDQLEGVLQNWRASFRPEKKPAAPTAAKPMAAKPAAKKPAARKPAAKKPVVIS